MNVSNFENLEINRPEPTCDDVIELSDWQREAGPLQMVRRPWSDEFVDKFGERGVEGPNPALRDRISSDGVIVQIRAFDRTTRRRNSHGMDPNVERAISVRGWACGFIIEHCPDMLKS